MSIVQINHLNSIDDILIVSTADGLILKKGQDQIKTLENIYITETKVLDNTNLLIQSKSSLYIGVLDSINFTFSTSFLTSENFRITSSLKEGNSVFYSLYRTDTSLTVERINVLTKNKDSLLIDSNLKYETVIGIFKDSNDLILATKNRLVKYNLLLGVKTQELLFSSKATTVSLLNNLLYIGKLDNKVEIYDLAFALQNDFQTEGTPLGLIGDSGSISALSLSGITDYDLTTLTTSVNSIPAISLTTLNGVEIITDGEEIKDLVSGDFVDSFVFDRDSLPNYANGSYKSKPINISTNNDTASFTWNQDGPTPYYQTSLTTTQSTDLINFSEYSEPSTSNKGVFVPNITPLTQAVGFELFVSLVDQTLPAPKISNFALNTNQKPNEAEPPINLVKAETLVTQTSYPQKFFAQSEVKRRHDKTFLKDTLLDTEAKSTYDSVPYGFNYEFKSKIKDQFGRFSKESYNPLKLNYTSKKFALSSAPVKNVNFTVVNPSEIFVLWDPVNELVDGTPIPQEVGVLYKILRKDDSNSIYRTIYGDNLVSLNIDYVCSTEPLNNDLKQLTDGISDPTLEEEQGALIFIEPVEVTFNLDTSRPVTHLHLSFLKGYAPDKIDLQILKGASESEVFTFEDIDFSLDQNDLEELTIRSINLTGDKVKITFTPNETEVIKITEVEIYGGVTPTNRTHYRDFDVNFKDGSQYYYIVQAQLTDLVTPTNFPKEQQTIQTGPKAILGLTNATDGVLRISLNQNNAIEDFVKQESLPVKLQNLSSVLIDDNIVVLGGRLENTSANLASSFTFNTQINGKVQTEILGTKFGPFTVISGDNDQFIISLDKKPEVAVTFIPGVNTAEQIALSINQALNADPNYGEEYSKVAVVRGRQIRLERPRLGLIDRINIGSGSANKLLGFNNKDIGLFKPRIDMRSNKSYHTSWYVDGYIFVLGGMFDTINKLPTDEILRSQVHGQVANLSLFNSVKLLPMNLYGHGQATSNPYIYIIGGISDNEEFSDRCYLSYFDSNTNNLANWIPTSALPIATAHSTCQIIGDYFYMIGGKQFDGNTKSVTKDIYRATIDSNHRLNNWQKIEELPKALYLSSSVVVDNKIFVIGGKTRNERLSRSIYGLEIDSNGDIIDISVEESLPMTLASTTAVVKDNNIYIIGGEVNAGYELGQQIDIIPSNI